MLYILVLIFSLTAKNNDIVVSADTSFSFELESGRGKFRIFEDNWSDLEISVFPEVPFSVFDEDHELVAQTNTGNVIINSFRDYWFTVSFSGLRENKLEMNISRIDFFRKLNSIRTTGRLTSEKPAEVLVFYALISGRYEFNISSDDVGGDADINLYINNYDFAASGTSNTNNEQVFIDAVKGDSIFALIFLNEIKAKINWVLSIERNDDINLITIGKKENSRMTNAEPRRVFLMQNTESEPVLLYLESDDEVDLDLHAVFNDSIYKSISYSSTEAILIPPHSDDISIVVEAFDMDQTSVRYSLSAIPVNEFHTMNTKHITKRIAPGEPEIFGIIIARSGYGTFEVSSIEKRDVDMILYNKYGVSDLSFTSMNPREVSVLWLNRRDTVYIMPMIFDRATDIDIYFDMIDENSLTLLQNGETIEDVVRPPYDGVKFYMVKYEQDGTGVITVRGESHRERDVDLILVGRNLFRRSEGEENPSDRASDETILFNVEEGDVFIAEIYAYGRGDRCRYQITSKLIPDNRVSRSDVSGNVWAVIVGISGYPGESALNRASQDALEMYEILLLSGFITEENTVFLADENATREDIVESIKRISRLVSPGDVFLFFFSGHGCQDRYSEGVLEIDGYDEGICPYPVGRDDDIYDDEIAEMLPEGIDCVIFLDACHSGGFVEDILKYDNRLVITASEEDREVGERVLTPILLRALSGRADENRDRYISSEELIDYVRFHSKHTCPECLYEFSGNIPRRCPNCGISLTGENRPMDPELGSNIDPDKPLIPVTPGGKK